MALTLLVAGGSGPPFDDAYTVAAITPDGDDIYRTHLALGQVTVAAPATNDFGNLRMVAARDDVELSVDQESCITWLGPRHEAAQPGLALRVTASGGGTRAITVSNNVWLQDRSSFNVHLADSAGDDFADRMKGIGEIQLPSGLGDGAFTRTPLPWRMCARAAGTTIEVKAWSLTEHPDEPSWDDLGFAGSVEVPQDWVYEGRPGFYMAHLAPGERAYLVDEVTRTLAPTTGG